MIKTPLSTVIGGAFWTPGATVINGAKLSFEIVMKKLFANGEQGFFYDPNDLSTMYQDAAGTIPVTAVGQPVGLIRDKSGRNNHAFQPNSASRPILRQNAVTGANYLEFDGSDDFLQTNNIDFTATDKVSLFAGVRKLSDAGTGMFVELSTSADINPNSFYLAAPTAGVSSFRFYTRGSSSVNAVGAPFATHQAPVSAVLTVKAQMTSQAQHVLRVNQSSYSIQNFNAIGNYGNYPLYIGRRGGTAYPFNGHIYSLIGIGRLTTDSETITLEKSIAKNTGVTLSV